LQIADFRLQILAELPQPGNRSSLRVARVMALDALRQEAFAAALATAREGSASAFGPHAGAKTVLAFARSLGWLISAFHKTEKFAGRELRAVTLGWSGGLSTLSGEGCSLRRACPVEERS